MKILPLLVFILNCLTVLASRADNITWEFNGKEKAGTPYGLEVRGSCEVGSTYDGEGDGFSALFEGGYLNVEAGGSIELDFEKDFAVWCKVFLNEQYWNMDAEVNSVIFQWMGNGARGKRNMISLECLKLGYIQKNAYLGVWLNNKFLHVSIHNLKPGIWQDVLLLVRGGGC